MFDRVLNLTLLFYGIAILRITLAGSFFIKISGYVSTALLSGTTFREAFIMVNFSKLWATA